MILYCIKNKYLVIFKSFTDDTSWGPCRMNLQNQNVTLIKINLNKDQIEHLNKNKALVWTRSSNKELDEILIKLIT